MPCFYCSKGKVAFLSTLSAQKQNTAIAVKIPICRKLTSAVFCPAILNSPSFAAIERITATVNSHLKLTVLAASRESASGFNVNAFSVFLINIRNRIHKSKYFKNSMSTTGLCCNVLFKKSPEKKKSDEE